jgi:CDP-6-deoxy-D-xylo-4-hexulose-3-dehydrase
LEDVFEFSLPTHATAWIPPRDRRGGTTFADSFAWDASGCRTDASWFGFMLRVRATAPFTHTELARHLDAQKIGNRMFFGGNLLRQPAFVQLRRDRPDSFRVVGDLDGADAIMNQAIFLGTYPGLTRQMLSYEVAVIHDFVTAKRHSKAV